MDYEENVSPYLINPPLTTREREVRDLLRDAYRALLISAYGGIGNPLDKIQEARRLLGDA